MSNFTLQLPKAVQQYKEEKLTCWAAALESWLDVTPQSPASWYVKTQDDALNAWGPFTDTTGGLDVSFGLKLMFAGVGIERVNFKGKNKITGAFLYSKLKKRGHIYLCYAGGINTASGQVGHCVVVYGIKNPWSNNCSVSYMDPWFGNYKVDEPLSYFQQANEVIPGWFEYTAHR